MAKLQAIAAEQEAQASSSLSPMKSSIMAAKDNGPNTSSKAKHHGKAGSMIVMPTKSKDSQLPVTSFFMNKLDDNQSETSKKQPGFDDASSITKKRKRKNKKGAADPQEAMNAFIRDQF